MINKNDIDLERDRRLVENIITLFLSEEELDTIAKKTNQTVDFVKWILNYKKMIINCFGDPIWNQVETRKKELIAREKEIIKQAQYEQLMKNIIFYMLNSLYTYNEIAELTFTNITLVQEMVSNTDYILQKFGMGTLKELKKMIELRRGLLSSVKNGNIVKNPKYRKLINPDIFIVNNYEYSLIEKASLFLECDGSTEKIIQNNDSYHINDIVFSLKNKTLESLLLPNVYEKLKKLLEIDMILLQNRLSDCRSLIKEVVLRTYEMKGNIIALQDTLDLPAAVIKRILNHPYTKVVCKSLQISPSDIELKEIDKESQLIINMADYIIEYNASYEETAKNFGISKSTVGEYMKNKLPLISPKRSKQINHIVKNHTCTKEITSKVKERVLFEYELLMKGYNLTQIAYLINGSYSTIQRDISKRLPLISEEKGMISKERLEHNKSKIYRKN